MLKKKIIYIADFSLPNKSAYSLHVLKICDAFNEYTKKTSKLVIPFLDENYTVKKRGERVKKKVRHKHCKTQKQSNF